METLILTIPPATTHAFDLCSRYSIDQSQIVPPDPSSGAGISLNRVGEPLRGCFHILGGELRELDWLESRSNLGRFARTRTCIEIVTTSF